MLSIGSPAAGVLIPKSGGLFSSAQRPDRGAAAVARLRSELLLDPQQLVVFRGAVGARERAGLDLPAIGGDGEVGDGGILGFAGTMGHHRGVARLMRHLDG